MSTFLGSPRPPVIEYPDSDGLPMAENTLQFQWIVTIKEGLEAVFRDDPAVFIAGDLFWYPVEGEPGIRTAPDTLVAFGRPKGHRGSYRQWEEGGIAPQVVFEVLSPGNRAGEMELKRQFYERYGVEEYYIYDPDSGELSGWRRAGAVLEAIREMRGHVSARLGVRFEPGDGPDGLRILDGEGRPFLSYQELAEQRDAERHRADTEHHRAEAERHRAETERHRAEAERHRADAERHRAETASQRAERLAAKLRELGVDLEDAGDSRG